MSDTGNDTSDPFEFFARDIGTAHYKAQLRATAKRAATVAANRAVKVVQSEQDAPMVPSALEKKTADQSKQFRIYLRFKRAEYREMLQGPQGTQWRELSRVLRSMTLESGADLVAYIERQDWLHDADLRTRQVALSVIADVIIKLRLENGYAPMDDSLPWEEPTVFEIIRSLLRVAT